MNAENADAPVTDPGSCAKISLPQNRNIGVHRRLKILLLAKPPPRTFRHMGPWM
jgi:hypothetical protein